MTKRTEILAPAGSFECVKAAVRSGADAVYLGVKSFNARRNADNFTDEELKRAIEYCHACSVKVHVTLNTLVGDDELESALQVIRHVCSLGADVLILQDLGLSALAKDAAPGLLRHASTQMSVQTVSGIELLRSLGYSTVVLPRELNREEIVAIRNSTDMRLEMFVHGALCMCVSGQCYLSAMLGGRSGNRGLCAQPCRLAFAAENGTGHDLSLKDLSLAGRSGELQSLGIDSLKIEGRMKRPEYVAAAVTAVRNNLDGKDDEALLTSLKAVFSRSGFTDGYFQNRLGRDMFGTRTKQDVTSANEKVLSSLRRLYDKEAARVPVRFLLTVLKDEPVTLCASSNGKSVFSDSGYIPEAASGKPLDDVSLKERLSKCGGTVFYAEECEVELDEGLFVPASVINSLRRDALEKLETALSAVKVIDFTDKRIVIPEHKASAPLSFNVRIASFSQIPENFDNVENLYIPLANMEKSVEKLQNTGVNIGIEIPRGIFGKEAYVESQLEKAKRLGIKTAYCGTLDAVSIAKKAGFEIHTGFSMNVFNSLSVNVLEQLGVKEITLSPELTLPQAERIGFSAKRGIIAYGRLPLMLTRNCPIQNGKRCDECKGKSYLTDRMGIRFPVVCNMGTSEVLNSRPIYLADRLDEIKNMDFVTLYFTRESGEAVDRILAAYRKGKAAKGDFTRGLSYRGVE